MTFNTVKPSILGAHLKRRKWTEQDGKFASWSDHSRTSGHCNAGYRWGRPWAAGGPNMEPPPGSPGLSVWDFEKRRGQEEMISTAEGPWHPFHWHHWCLTTGGNARSQKQSGQSDVSLPWTKITLLSALNNVILNPVANPSLVLQRLRILKLYL